MRKFFGIKNSLAIATLVAAGFFQAAAATISWTNTTGGNWNVTNNWSPNTVPAAGDTVFITNAGTYTVSVNVSPTLNGLTVGSAAAGSVTVNLAATTLTLNGASFFETNSVFNLFGGTLAGTGTAIFAGQFTWSGGTMATSGGRTVFTNTATVSLTTANAKTFQQRTVDNYTTINWLAGGLNIGFGGTWNNYGSFDIQGDLGTGNIGGGIPVFNNFGTLRKSSGAGATHFGFAVNNANTVASQSGTLGLANGGVSSGGFTANASCNLDFSGGTHTLLAGANFAGGGVFRINGSGVLDIAALLTVTPAFELAPNGILGGTNTVIFAGPFTWSGGTMATAGRTVFTNSATVSLTTANAKTFQQRTVDNYTTINWLAGGLNIGFGGSWNNYGSFDIQGDLGTGNIGGGVPVFNNSGTLRKSGGAGAAHFGYTVNNTGTVASQSGTLGLGNGGVSSGGFTANASGLLDFSGGTHTLLAGANFVGGGVFRINGSGILDIATLLTITPAFELAPNGILGGTNTVIFAGPFTWSGGTMATAGRTVFTNTATVSLTTASAKTFQQRTVDNYTTINWLAGGLNIGFGGTWNNYGSFDIQGDLGTGNIGGGIPVFNNFGTLRKSSGAGATHFGFAVNNANTVASQSGTLGLGNGGVSSGNFTANGSCFLDFSAGTHTLVAGANFAGAGLFRINGSGVLDIAALLTIIPAFELAPAGILGGTNTVIFAGPFTWSGGTMATAGRTVFTNSATVSLTTANAKTFQQRTVDNYTTINWLAGGLNIGFGGSWNNHGTFDIQGDLGTGFIGGGVPVFNNAGTLRKSAGVGAAHFGYTVNNIGTVASQSGTLGLGNGGMSSGSFTASGSCFLDFSAGTHTLVAGANFAGAGLFRINGSGVLDIAALLTVTPAFELAPSGILGGTNTVNFAGPFTWSGGTMATGGRTVFTNTATVSLTTANAKTFQQRTVDNYTTINWLAGSMNIGFGGTWNNYGTFELQGDLGTGNIGGGIPVFNNSGTLSKSAGAGATHFGFAVNNTGTVASQSGTLGLGNGGVSSGGFTVNASCNLDFSGGTHTLLAGANFAGGGVFRINGSGILDIAALLTVTPAFELALSGILGGTNTVIFAGPFTWSGGTMATAGRTVFTNTATVSLTTANAKTYQQRTVDNYTTINWLAGAMNIGFGGTWNNYGTFDIQGDLGTGNIGGGIPVFNNFGTLRKSAGVGSASFGFAVTNAGTVRSQSGTIGVPRSYVQTSGLTELAGGNFSGVLLDIQSGLLTGTGNIAANVRNAAQIAPGTGVGLLTITNAVPQTYTSTTNSLLTFQIGGLPPGSGHDQLVVNSSATLAGTLRAELANGYVPTPGNTYTVMTFTARSGVFTNFSFPNYDFAVVQNSTNVILIASNALPAVSVTGPSNQLVCAPFVLQTAASDLDGTVTNLSLFFDANLLASYPDGAAREVQLTYDFPGPVTVTARASDEKGGIRETNITMLFYTLPLNTINLGGKLASGEFKFCMLGESGKNYDVLVNTNLAFPSNWTAIGAMENTNGIWRFTDPAGTNYGPRYYRARQQ